MNSYQIYNRENLSNNRIQPNGSRLNYVYNRANQNIDHLRNFNNYSNEKAPIRINKNIYRNESNEASPMLNYNAPNFLNKQFND